MPVTTPVKPPAKAPAKPKKRKSAGKKAEVAKDSSESIRALTAAFLKAGGEVEVIPSGVSGQQSMAPGRKHITLGNSNKSTG
jgi:hypothetical protein